jgi:hypothetical protein
VRDIVNEKYKSLVEVAVLIRHYGSFSMLEPEIRLFQPDVSLELHFNSYSAIASGCEILVYRDGPRPADNIRLADIITDRLQRVFGFRQRNVYRLDNESMADGVKVLSEGRGVQNLRVVHDCGVPLVMLLEPVFANHKTSESMRFFKSEQRYVDFLVDAIGEDIRKTII